jgi:hypothetical protein
MINNLHIGFMGTIDHLFKPKPLSSGRILQSRKWRGIEENGPWDSWVKMYRISQ